MKCRSRACWYRFNPQGTTEAYATTARESCDQEENPHPRDGCWATRHEFDAGSSLIRSIVNPMNRKLSTCVITLLGILFVSSLSSLSQAPKILPHASHEKAAPPPVQTPQVTPQLTKDDLGAFFDGFVPVELQRDDIAGAVVLVVKDGSVLFAKGYGYSDMKSKKPVTVDATLFRPGSISKTFTWTAVMQLVEQGKIDLNRDVNDYLDFKIPATFGKPITMKDLMTHTPGFEETLKDLFVANASDMRPLERLHDDAPAGADLPSGYHACLFELRCSAGGLHCAARLRHAFRRLR